jgi:surfactin synthase thioesterase subunit
MWKTGQQAIKVCDYLTDGKALNVFGICYGGGLALEVACLLQEQESYRVNQMILASAWAPHVSRSISLNKLLVLP